MKKHFAIMIAIFISVCAFAQEPLLYDESYIHNQEGLYWEFKVPEYSECIKIDCSTSAVFSWKMKFVIVPTKKDAIYFCAGQHFNYVDGTYKIKAQNYSIILNNLVPGTTYYFCAFNDTYGFTAASYYKIVPVITAY